MWALLEAGPPALSWARLVPAAAWNYIRINKIFLKNKDFIK